MNEPAATDLPVILIGLNHKAAPVSLREQLAFGPESTVSSLRELAAGKEVIQEAVLLSTCNRSEVYITTCHPMAAISQVLLFLCTRGGLPSQQLQSVVYIKQGHEVVRHLMQVAAGLDSLILGESEILGQVRSASAAARAAGTSGPILSCLFRFAVQAGKRARAETAIGKSSASLAGIVVELAGQSLGPLKDRTALLIGAGKISSITARALARAGLRCIMVANRTYERAVKLARSLHGAAVRFDALDETLAQADIVICSTGAPHIVLHAEKVLAAQQARGGRPLLVADLAVPRDADPQIASISGVHLINIDDLAGLVKARHPLTALACRQVEAILQEESRAFSEWYDARRCVSVIRALHDKAEGIYRGEVERTLRRLGPLSARQERLIEAMAKAITGKLLHEPTVRLRRPPANGNESSYAEIVQELYGL